MRIIYLTNPVDIVQHWPKLRLGFDWLQERTNFKYEDEKTLQTLCHMVSTPEQSYIGVLYRDSGELESFLIAYDATPIYEDEKVFQIFALMHRPSQIRTTRRLLNNFELWAIKEGATHIFFPTRKYGKSSLSLFSKLGFKRDCLILTKEL